MENTSAIQAPAPKAVDLSKELAGSYDERMREDKTIVITLSYGKKPDVVFTGFWSGKLVSSATNAIARSYRLLKYKNIRPNPTTPNKENGDART